MRIEGADLPASSPSTSEAITNVGADPGDNEDTETHQSEAISWRAADQQKNAASIRSSAR
jgi:hypothetical protein